MRLLRGMILIVLVSLPAPAWAAIRAVFIGIDTYAYSNSRPQYATADFKDLSGAVNDAQNIKKALGAAYTLGFDGDVAGKCSTANALSITLTNECATRKAILEAWANQIGASKSGDTLILYYAGHGSQFVDLQDNQASGYNDTILPYDARKPGGDQGEIYDRQIKDIIDGATAKGINVVTIFDSCNSGTATRDPFSEGESRSALRRVARAGDTAARPPASANDDGLRGVRAFGLGAQELKQGSGYRVHFAAAADGEDAREVGVVGDRAGVFTTALIEAVRAMPEAAFADIATEVRLKVAERGHNAQHPQAEGALNATMGGAERRGPLFALKAAGGQVWLQDGQVSGVTLGSTFALYLNATTALSKTAEPLASARVVRVEPFRAALEFDGGVAPALTPKAVAIETRHAFGEQSLLVRNGAGMAEAARLKAILANMPFVRVGEPATVSAVPSGGEYKLLRADGGEIAKLGAVTDPGFVPRLELALQKIARVQALLALRTGAPRNFCVTADLEANAYACELPDRSDGPVLRIGEKAKLIVTNKAPKPRYLYVYAIDDSYQVNLAIPERRGIDIKLDADKAIAVEGRPTAKGRLTFLTLSTTEPIKADVLEQSGIAARGTNCNVSALARALCAAQRGGRDVGSSQVVDWSATVVSAIVK